MHRVRLSRAWIGSLIFVIALVFAAPVFAQDQTYVVQPGENLFRIALKFGVDVTVLAQANGITNTWQIYAGQTLVIPSGDVLPAPADTSAPPPADTSAQPNPTYYTVQRGEHLVNIAQRFGLTAEQLIQMNQLANPNLIFAGQQLLVTLTPPEAASAPPAPVEVAPAASGQQTTYVVQPGDRLASIAAQFSVTWPAIAQVNNLADPNTVYAGQTLVIPAPGSTAVNDYGIVTASNLPAAPAAAVAVGKSIVVDLSDSRIYGYENGGLVRNVLVSTGLPGTPTVVGDFSIYVKYVATLMTGPGYYLPDVPYTMYFYEGYGIHGTYWHHNFGVPMSHGCVNLPTPEAEWFFNWAPVGTPVHVQY